MSIAQPLKILAIQFKYFGDTAVVIPALRAIRQRHPDCGLHVLTPEQTAPLLQHLPWLTRVWPMPRIRGRANFRQTWPMIRALRAQRFDRSVDFAGNDRGAILSWLCGAPERLGVFYPGGFVGRRFCCTRRVAAAPADRHETLRLIHVLSAWQIAAPGSAEIELHPDPALADWAARLLPAPRILCHLTASQPNRQWPLSHWVALHRMAAARGEQLLFSAGDGARERSLFDEMQRLAPDVALLPPLPLAAFLAVLKRAKAFVSGDTGPMHFAAGLGVPSIALFGPSSAARWGPTGRGHQVMTGGVCACGPSANVCSNARHCLAAITPEAVFLALKRITVC